MGKRAKRKLTNRADTHLGALQQLGLAGGDVLLLAAPCAQHGRLQGATVREGQRPRLQQRHLVDQAQVHGGLLLRLAARQEGHTCAGIGGNNVVQYT